MGNVLLGWFAGKIGVGRIKTERSLGQRPFLRPWLAPSREELFQCLAKSRQTSLSSDLR